MLFNKKLVILICLLPVVLSVPCITFSDCPLESPKCLNQECTSCSTDNDCVLNSGYSYTFCNISTTRCEIIPGSLTFVGYPSSGAVVMFVIYGIISLFIVIFVILALVLQQTKTISSYNSTANSSSAASVEEN